MIKIDINKQLHGSNGEMNLDINLDIENSDFIVLTGASGSGKTTMLRILSGLENAQGTIKVDNENWLNDNFSLAPQKRNIGFVFQDYALFPNMNIIQNLLFVNNNQTLANHLLDITELQELKYKFPNTLSGGQKQRVALCRAMMNNPKILLLDEPLSALDIDIKLKLQDELIALHNEFKTTTIMVSHDIQEINRLSDRIITLENGKIIKDIKTNKQSLEEGKLVKLSKNDSNHTAIIEIDNKLVEVKIPL